MAVKDVEYSSVLLIPLRSWKMSRRLMCTVLLWWQRLDGLSLCLQL